MKSFGYVLTPTSPSQFLVSRTEDLLGEVVTYTVDFPHPSIQTCLDTTQTQVAADLFDIAIAVQNADYLSKRDIEHCCRIAITLPVRNPVLLSESNHLLEDILFWYTGDQWEFNFVQRKDNWRQFEIQRSFIVSGSSEVVLWSGGLDSYAGVCNFLQSYSTDNFNLTLIGSGSDNFMQGIQDRLIHELIKDFPRRLSYYLLPINKSGVSGIPKNSWSRSRGFVFVLIGSVIAYLQGLKQLLVFENGVGAINLPLLMSSTGIDHAKSVHPFSLMKISEFLSAAFNMDFKVNNPFLWKTKAEMCRIFVDYPELLELAYKTVSCDKKPHIASRQCGVCSSCILRQQAFLAAGFEDHTEYGVDDPNWTKQNRFQAFNAMQSFVQRLSNAFDSPHEWQSLVNYFPDVAQILSIESGQITDVRNNTINLFETFVQEWNLVEKSISDRIA